MLNHHVKVSMRVACYSSMTTTSYSRFLLFVELPGTSRTSQLQRVGKMFLNYLAYTKSLIRIDFNVLPLSHNQQSVRAP
jgi:hypothetical protein